VQGRLSCAMTMTERASTHLQQIITLVTRHCFFYFIYALSLSAPLKTSSVTLLHNTSL